MYIIYQGEFRLGPSHARKPQINGAEEKGSSGGVNCGVRQIPQQVKTGTFTLTLAVR